MDVKDGETGKRLKNYNFWHNSIHIVNQLSSFCKELEDLLVLCAGFLNFFVNIAIKVKKNHARKTLQNEKHSI
jgi:hypothetical protein